MTTVTTYHYLAMFYFASYTLFCLCFLLLLPLMANKVVCVLFLSNRKLQNSEVVLECWLDPLPYPRNSSRTVLKKTTQKYEMQRDMLIANYTMLCGYRRKATRWWTSCSRIWIRAPIWRRSGTVTQARPETWRRRPATVDTTTTSRPSTSHFWRCTTAYDCSRVPAADVSGPATAPCCRS